MAFPNFLVPYGVDDLVRIGSLKDGGYVVPRVILKASKSLLTLGLSGEWSFESDFYRLSKCRIAAFDHTVNSRFWVKNFFSSLFHGTRTLSLSRAAEAFNFLSYKRFFNSSERAHYQKMIGGSAEFSVDLSQAMNIADMHADVFLKVDIEGWEYRILHEIRERSACFTGLAIEFHDIDLHEQRLKQFVEDIEHALCIVHLHANNCGSIVSQDYSNVIEVTFLNRALFVSEPVHSMRNLPIRGLDYPNNPNRDDVNVKFDSFES